MHMPRQSQGLYPLATPHPLHRSGDSGSVSLTTSRYPAREDNRRLLLQTLGSLVAAARSATA